MTTYLSIPMRDARRFVLTKIRGFAPQLEQRGTSVDDVFANVVTDLQRNGSLIADPINRRFLVVRHVPDATLGTAYELLASVAKCRAIDRTRRKPPRERPESDLVSSGADGVGAASLLDRCAAPEAPGAVDAPEVSELLRRHEVDGWSLDRCAAQFGITADAARSRMYRERKEIRERFARWNGDDDER